MNVSMSSRPTNGRILHVIDTGGPGGAETVFKQIALGLQNRGWEAATVVSREGWLAEQLRHHSLNPQIVPPTQARLAYLKQIMKIARREEVSVIIAHLLGAGFYASLAGLLTRIPVISIFHGQKDLEKSRMNWLKGRALSAPKGCTVFVSDALRVDLQPKLGLNVDRCTVINNGVDLDNFKDVSSTLRQRLSLDAETILVGAVGNIREPKAYNVLLHATAEIVRQDERIQVLVAGEGRPPLFDELSALHRKLELGDRFQFLGLVEDVPEFLAGLDIFVLSSHREGFSIACVEAMAAELPVVATRSGGPEAIVEDNVTGQLVPVGDPVELAEAILLLADDDIRRKTLGTAGKIRAQERFGIDKCIDAYCQLITRLSTTTPVDNMSP